MIKQYVSNITPSIVLKFIDERLSHNNYRGVESSQHNRYDLTELIETLKLLDKYAPNQSSMYIRHTDLSKRPQNLPEENQYALFCDEVVKKVGKGTQDSIRKNLFVDWHRMGFIKRFNVHHEEVDPFLRKPVRYVALSNLGKKIIDEKISTLERYYLFSKAIDILLQDFIQNTLDLLSIDKLQGYIDFHEFMFFVTAINVPNYGIDVSKCAELILTYRKLPKSVKEKIVNILQTELQPEKFSGNKTEQRDWHNWCNKNQQVWHLLNEVVFFIFDKQNNLSRLSLITKDSDITKEFSRRKMKRSPQAKADYFTHHKIVKTLGYELDHIVPLMQANSIHEFKYLDCWLNLLYIDGKSHAIKTQTGSKYNRLSSIDGEILRLSNFKDEHLIINRGQEGLFDLEQIDKMLKFNQDFWKS